MSAPKHTPGPWISERRNGWHDVVSANFDADTVARVHDVMDGDGGFSNATLIAAAPDLLEALEAVEQVLEGDGMPASAERGLKTLATVRAAIKKARGGES